MNCLNCKEEMMNISVQTKKDQISYDICEACGSLWLDAGELNKIAYKVAGDIEYCSKDKVKKNVLANLQNARFYLEKNNDKKYREIIKNILQHIGKIDDKLKLYIDDVLDKAKIVKGSKLYEHGVSIERAAELLGISQWELMSYVGKTQIIDRYDEEVIPVKIRLDYAKKLFKV